MFTVAIAWRNPPLGVRIFWGAFVPSLPLIFLIAPGTWRNVCPMAALNQVPRTLGFTRGLTVPQRVQQFTPLISAGLFLLIVPLRKVVLEQHGPSLAIFLGTMLALAFVGGVLFKGKSGWCSQFCPMLQVERFYGQSPIKVIPNSHCRPCVGCAVNCYDFNPTAAYLADLHDEKPRLAANRKLFAGALPWFVVAFFTQPAVTDPTVLGIVAMYARFLFFIAAGIGAFYAIESITRLSSQQLALIHVVVTLNLFYFFVTPIALRQFGIEPSPLAELFQVLVGLVSVIWFRRATPVERVFLTTVGAPQIRVADTVLRVHDAGGSNRVEVNFHAGPTVMAEAGELLLVVAEVNKVPIQSGCRMGMCGADPVRILDGDDHLSPAGVAERATLEQLGLSADCRLACTTRVHGHIVVSTRIDPDVPDGAASSTAEPEPPGLPAVGFGRRIVVVGSGVSGVTAALEVRKYQPACDVTIIGSEPYDFYNRMMIGKLMSESISIDQLYMMPRNWADTRGVRFVSGVVATRIDREERTVSLADGSTLPFDRLILATGARSSAPRIDGFGIDGTFVLRTIDDAVQIQQYIRRHRCRTAAVVGGGLLGLEAAHFLTQIGVRVSVLDRNDWPLSRQLDRVAGTMLGEMMRDLGIEIVLRADTLRLIGSDRVFGLELRDGRAIEAGVCIAAVGIEPNVGLARDAGLDVRRGVIVNDRMETSDPAIFAAGDVAEHAGQLYGLWPAGMEQARVAAVNASGGDQCYVGTIPPARLKVAAIDLLSVGDVRSTSGARQEICFEDASERRYRKLIVESGRIRGAILIGHPELAEALSDAVQSERDVTLLLPALEQGDWTGLLQ
jgi:NADPH-dependent 2,4-dienoyl-CoA reductase/sulfur reductase-like enzyme/ferredoxin